MAEASPGIWHGVGSRGKPNRMRQVMSKKDVSEIERGAGFFQGFVAAMMGVVREKGVPFVAIYRLATDNGRPTLVRIVDLAHADWLDEQPKPSVAQSGGTPYRGGVPVEPLPADHYRVYVSYAPMPSLADLKKEFGEKNVSDIFDGRTWELHASCVGMSRTPGDKIFFFHDVGRAWEREERIAWGLAQRTAVAPNGYRPATHDEEYEFQKAHPELLDYVALGSSTPFVRRYVARVWCNGGQRILDDRWIGFGFGARNRVLLVSK